jgi:hypothetical protein
MKNSVNIAASLCSVATGALGLYLQLSSPGIANLMPELDLLLGLADDVDQGPQREPLPVRTRDRPGDLCDDLDAKLVAELALAKTKLAIARDQEPAWQRFTAAFTASAEPLRRECAASATQPTPATLPQSLSRAERRLGAALEVAHAVRPAADALYGQLAPAQQDGFDALVRRLP